MAIRPEPNVLASQGKGVTAEALNKLLIKIIAAANSFDTSLFLPLTGGGMTGLIQSNQIEALRINNSSAFLSFYNSAGTTRTGFLQGAAANVLALVAENGTTLQLSAGGNTWYMGTNGNLGTAAATGSPGQPLTVWKAGTAITGNWVSVADFRDGTPNKGIALGYDSSAQLGLIVATSNGPASGLTFWNWDGATWGESMRIDGSRKVGIGLPSQGPNLQVTADTGDGPILALRNRTINGSVHKYGALVFMPYRDVADPVYGAAIWSDGASAAGYTASLVFGTSVNLAAATFPTEFMRIDQAGNLLVSPGTGTGQSIFGSAGRGVIEVNGTADSLIAFKKSGVYQGYLYYDGSSNGHLNVGNSAQLNLEASLTVANGNFKFGATTQQAVGDGGGAAWGSALPIGSIISGQKNGAGCNVALGGTVAFNGTNFVTGLGQDSVNVNVQYGTWRSLGNINAGVGCWIRIA